MWRRRTNFWCVIGIILGFLDNALGHGILVDPPARNYMGEVGFDVPVNYNGNSLNCGGTMNQWQTNGGKCGLCGDPYQGPRDHEAGGIYATGTVGRCYPVGTIPISVKIKLTAYHGGYFEFRLCEHDDPHSNITQSCLDRHVLTISDTGNIKYDINSIFLEDYVINIDLPDGITCKFCVLQWKYHAGYSYSVNGTHADGLVLSIRWDCSNDFRICPYNWIKYYSVLTKKNSWGCDESGCGIGYGHQEQFYNCADVAILPICLMDNEMDNDTNSWQADAAFEDPQSGTYLGETESSYRSPVRRTICHGVGVWEHASSMAEWCTQNCLGSTKYCPESLCACKQVEENVMESYQEYKPKNTTVAIGQTTIIHEGTQENQTHIGKESQIPKADQADEAYRVKESQTDRNILEPQHRRKGARVMHFLYLFDPVASGLIKTTNFGFHGSLFSSPSENNDVNSKGRFFQNYWKTYGGHCWLSDSEDEEEGHIDKVSHVTVLSGRCHPSENRHFEVEVRIKGFTGENGWKCSESDCDADFGRKTHTDKQDELTNCLDLICAHNTTFLKPKKDTVLSSKEDSKSVEKHKLELSDGNTVPSKETQETVSSTKKDSKCIPQPSVELSEIQDSDKASISDAQKRPGKEEEKDGNKYDHTDTQNLRKPQNSTSNETHKETTNLNLIDSSNERLTDGHVCYGVGQWAGTKDMDDWCMFTCFHSKPYCPEEYCACSIPDPIIMGRNMEKKKKSCIAVLVTTPEKDLTDWCNISCNNNPPYCPLSLCLCE